jgi:hypothetical protein
MEYHRITSIEDPLFRKMHQLMQTVFPPEEVLAFDLWKEPLEDEGIRVFVAVHEGEVVGATEYRYYADDEVAMTDFTIIGREGLGVGPFLVRKREEDLQNLVRESGSRLLGMFAEVYNPYLVENHAFGGIKPMDPFVRREVLSHLGYRRLNFSYVHPSWQQDGTPVNELDLCFLPYEWKQDALPGSMIAKFLRRYYSVLPNKPESWYKMVEELETRDQVELLPF